MPVELMKLANSVRVAFPRMMAPARRSFRVMNASFAGMDPPSATDPAVVGMSAVSMLSLRMSGTPNKGFLRRSEEHTSELQSRLHLVCRLLLEKKNHRPGH